MEGVAFHNCVLFFASVGDIAQFSRAISEIPRPPGTASSWCFFSRICFAAVGLENGWAQLVEWATEGGHPIMPQILQKIGRTTGLYLQCQRPWHLKGEQSATGNEPFLEWGMFTMTWCIPVVNPQVLGRIPNGFSGFISLFTGDPTWPSFATYCIRWLSVKNVKDVKVSETNVCN